MVSITTIILAIADIAKTAKRLYDDYQSIGIKKLGVKKDESQDNIKLLQQHQDELQRLATKQAQLMAELGSEVEKLGRNLKSLNNRIYLCLILFFLVVLLCFLLLLRTLLIR